MIVLKQKPLDDVRNEPDMITLLEQSITDLEIRDAEKDILIQTLQCEIDKLIGNSTKEV